MKKILMLAALTVLSLAGPVLAPTPPTALGAAGSAALADSRCPASATRCVYRVPDHIATARTACIRAEREKRGIPGEQVAYVRWFEANRGTSTWTSWRTAYQACLDRHQLPGGKWAWEQMIYVRAEGNR